MLRRATYAICIGILSALALALPLPGWAQRQADFTETFTGNPSRPQPFVSPRWDTIVHSRGHNIGQPLQAVAAHHGADCGPHPGTHTVNAVPGSVFSCRDHLMTAISDDGYGLVYLTPDRMVDFSTGEAVVRFDMSTLRTSHRDWVDLWITPYGDNLAAPLEDWLPDLNGRPRNAIHVRMDSFNGGSVFKAHLYRNGVETELSGPGAGWDAYESHLTPSAVTRSTFELRISRTHVTFSMPSVGLTWVDDNVAALGWTKGVVQLGHHSYNPTKDCNGGPCQPNSWHWDNV